MVIWGALVNGIAVLAAGVLGLLFRRHVSERLGDFLMSGMGLVVVLVAVQGMMRGDDVIVVVVSIATGGIIGYLIDIDLWVHRFGDWIQHKIDVAFKGRTFAGNFSTGFVTSTLFICVGAMAIVGSLESGLELNHATLYAKSLIDFVVIVVMAATMGIGVPFSGFCVFAYEAILSLAASALAPLLTDAMINEMVCTGSLLLLGIGLNMLKVTDIKVANFLPAAFMPIAILPLMSTASTLVAI